MIYAELTTRNFTFRTIGSTEDMCRGSLEKGWIAHAQKTGADLSYIADCDIQYFSLEPGEVLRDDHSVYPPLASKDETAVA